jgi:hypothetical protein
MKLEDSGILHLEVNLKELGRSKDHQINQSNILILYVDGNVEIIYKKVKVLNFKLNILFGSKHIHLQKINLDKEL